MGEYPVRATPETASRPEDLWCLWPDLCLTNTLPSEVYFILTDQDGVMGVISSAGGKTRVQRC